MVIVTTVSFNKANMYETERHIETFPPVPDYINMMGPYIKDVKFGGGIQTIHLFEFEELRLDEARDFIAERMRIYNEMADLTYSVDMWLSVEDVLNMTGLEMDQPYASA
ncbi:MAG: hypothetical protein JRD89_08225 [Deltaproteobacteria bacterium]|nr:hypothetical protein [Deltaproteobacteria bacterium]